MDAAAVIVQASSRTWSGGPDRCMRTLDGKPLLGHTLARVAKLFPGVRIHLVAPAFDQGRLDEIASAVQNCRVTCLFDDKPLRRLTHVTNEVDENALVVRIDGLHAFFQEPVIRSLLNAARAEGLDLAKSPDDFPPPLTGEVWRVGALRRIEHLLDSWPPDRAAPHNVHPKFLAMRGEGGVKGRIVEPPPITDETLRTIRASLARAFDEDHIAVTRQSIPAGDQISFHYRLVSRYLKPTDRVLDIASGNGFGGNIMADVAGAVTCADLDQDKLTAGRALFPRPNLVFSRQDVMRTGFADAAFDVVVSLETIEHMDDVDGYLTELRRVLRPGGTAVLSTPQNRVGHIPLTPAHVHEFGLDELRASCARHFEVERVVGLKAGTIFFDDDPAGANSVIFLRKP